MTGIITCKFRSIRSCGLPWFWIISTGVWQSCEHSLGEISLKLTTNASFGLARLRKQSRLQRSFQLYPFIVIPSPHHLINFTTLCALLYHRSALRDGVLQVKLAIALRFLVFSYKHLLFAWVSLPLSTPLRRWEQGKKSTEIHPNWQLFERVSSISKWRRW